MDYKGPVTSPANMVERTVNFKKIVGEIENQLGAAYPNIEEKDGYGPHISMDIDIPVWMRFHIEKLYQAVGWRLVFKNHGNVMFLLPTSEDK